MTENSKKVVVAMSGGVDSAAAALMLAEQGWFVVGVAMQVWDYSQHGGSHSRRSCCAPSDFNDARAVADKADFPFYVFDFEESFRENVVEPFISSYLKGYTPNPCLDCNRKVKFSALRRRAAAMGIPFVATGHYAQIKDKDDRTKGLFTSCDLQKDQSYFLYAMTQEDLSSTIFPVGRMHKEQVREYLRERGLVIASKAESQDICFVSTSVSEFVERYGIEQESKGEKRGKIITSQGRQVGAHAGVHRYTVGQRKGLGISNPTPLYVLQVDPQTQTVTVGEKEELARESFIVRDLSWISGTPLGPGAEVWARLRYRHAGLLCRVQSADESGVTRFEFAQGNTVVSPGQAAVFYARDLDTQGDREVLGGGIIERD